MRCVKIKQYYEILRHWYDIRGYMTQFLLIWKCLQIEHLWTIHYVGMTDYLHIPICIICFSLAYFTPRRRDQRPVNRIRVYDGLPNWFEVWASIWAGECGQDKLKIGVRTSALVAACRGVLPHSVDAWGPGTRAPGHLGDRATGLPVRETAPYYISRTGSRSMSSPRFQVVKGSLQSKYYYRTTVLPIIMWIKLNSRGGSSKISLLYLFFAQSQL